MESKEKSFGGKSTENNISKTDLLSLLNSDANNYSEIINNIINQKGLMIFDKSGKKIFEGNIDSFLIFLRKNQSCVTNISNISDMNNKTVVRFGARDGGGFVDRKSISFILKFEAIAISYIQKIINDIYFQNKNEYQEDMFLVGHGILPDGTTFPKISGEIGIHYDAHGISKGFLSSQLSFLINLLNHGIDKKKDFYTAPFEVPDDKRLLLGSALGTSGGTCYKDGLAIVCSGYKKTILNDGIRIVFINDVFGDIIRTLSLLFPQYDFCTLSQQKEILEKFSSLNGN